MLKKTMNIKKIIFIIVALVITSNVILLPIKHKKELSLQIKDTNGDSKQLCFITDEMISEITEEYRSIRRHVESEGLNTSGIKGHFSDCDHSSIKTRIGMLSGIYVCNSYLGDGGEITYTIESSVISGNMRIIITDEDNVLLYDIPIDSKETVSFVTEKSKAYYVKFVAESAKLDVSVERYSN